MIMKFKISIQLSWNWIRVKMNNLSNVSMPSKRKFRNTFSLTKISYKRSTFRDRKLKSRVKRIGKSIETLIWSYNSLQISSLRADKKLSRDSLKLIYYFKKMGNLLLSYNI